MIALDKARKRWIKIRTRISYLVFQNGSVLCIKHWLDSVIHRRSAFDDAIPLVFTALARGQLCLQPGCSLFSHMGVREGATHVRRTRLRDKMVAQAKTFPLRHPTQVVRNIQADRIAARNGLLNAPSGNVLLDSARSIAKHLLWAIRR